MRLEPSHPVTVQIRCMCSPPPPANYSLKVFSKITAVVRRAFYLLPVDWNPIGWKSSGNRCCVNEMVVEEKHSFFLCHHYHHRVGFKMSLFRFILGLYPLLL